MKLAIDARMAGKSGIGRYLDFVLRELSNRNGFDCVLLGDPEVLSPIAHPSWDIIPYREGIYSPKQHFGYPLKSNSVDVMFFPHIHVPLFSRPGKRVITTVHDCYHISDAAELSTLEKYYMRLYYSRAVRFSDKIVAVSDFTRSEIGRYLGKRFIPKCFVIHNAIDTTGRHPQNSPLVDSLVSRPGKKVLFVGNVKPHKNLPRLVHAFNRPELSKTTLIVVGKREGFINGLPIEQQKLLESENVVFTGWLSDGELARLYERVDLLVMPSLYEGFGLPPLESLAAHTPVAVADIPSLRETCGDFAAYFNPFDVSSIAKVVAQELKKSPRTDWSQVGDWLARYDIGLTTKRLVDILLSEKDETEMVS